MIKDGIYPQVSAENDRTGEENAAADAGRTDGIKNAESDLQSDGKGGEETGKTADAGEESSLSVGDEFESLIKGRYAAEFARRTQKIIDKRFRQVKETEEENRRLKDTIGKISERLNCGEDEVSDALERELGGREKRGARSLPEEAELVRQARETYPEFDFESCRKNERFMTYAGMGLTYAEAYTLANLDSIIRSAAEKSAGDTLRAIRSMGRRMPEFGESSPGGSALRPVSSLTSPEIREIVERAGAGERIELSRYGIG